MAKKSGSGQLAELEISSRGEHAFPLSMEAGMVILNVTKVESGMAATCSLGDERLRVQVMSPDGVRIRQGAGPNISFRALEGEILQAREIGSNLLRGEVRLKLPFLAPVRSRAPVASR